MYYKCEQRDATYIFSSLYTVYLYAIKKYPDFFYTSRSPRVKVANLYGPGTNIDRIVIL